MGLAPMAVAPLHQRRGIGSALVRAGVDEARQLGVDVVAVLGHPTYYPRFGFSPASRFSITCEYDVPDEAFMVRELRPGALAGKKGVVMYHAVFGGAKADVLYTATAFAEALDRREYDSLKGLLAPDCKYQFGDELVNGSENIIATYRKNSEWGFDVFDQIEFQSEVRPESDLSARITFRDWISHEGMQHEHVCEQIVVVDHQGRIAHIRHVELPGEAARLKVFFDRCGVTRP